MRAVALQDKQQGKQSVSLTAEATAGKDLAIHVLLEQRPTRPVILSIGCGELCQGAVDITKQLAALPLAEWHTIRVPLRSFAEAGADLSRVDRPLSIATDGHLVLRFADIEVLK